MLAMLSARFDLLAFDYRGMGASAAVTAPYSMADLAADVAGLLDVVGWESSAVAGLSFGGMVAQEFAVTFPERVDLLALLATSPGGAWPSYPLDRLAGLPAEQRSERFLVLADQRWTPQWLAAHPREAAFAASLNHDVPAEETQAQTTGRLLQLQARKGHDVVDRLNRISCQTLVGSGRYDDIAPIANGKAMADRIPGAMLRIYRGGHLFLMQDATAWPEVTEFLGGRR
jgi:pimeloyl-ACP methyl ester carboxylesterase